MRKSSIKSKLILFVALFFVSIAFAISCAFAFGSAVSASAGAEFKMLEPKIYFSEKDATKNGLIFTAELGENADSSIEYHMFIVPADYVNLLSLGNTDYISAVKNKAENVIDVVCTPYLDKTLSGNADVYYVSASLVSVKFDNINEDWFGLAYYVNNGEIVCASVESDGQNVANLPYLASKAIAQNEFDTESEADKLAVIKGFIADGFDSAAGNEKGTTDFDGITDLFDTQAVSVAPNKRFVWQPSVPARLKLFIEYSAENAAYADVSGGGIVKGVCGDGNSETYKNVYAKALGRQYAKPVHVYSIETAITSDADVMCTGDAVIDGVQYYKTASFGGLKIDGEDAFGIAKLKWFTTNPNVSISEQGVAECNLNGNIDEKIFYVYYKCDIGGVTFVSPMKKMKAICQKSAAVLKFEKSESSVYPVSAEEIFGSENVQAIIGVYDSENPDNNLFTDGNVNVANVPMGDRLFRVQTADSVITVKAIVADVIINDANDLTAFIELRSGANNDGVTKYNYGWNDKNSDGIVDDGERIYYALGDNISYGKIEGKRYRTSAPAKLLDDNKDVGFLGVFDGCGYTVTASDVRDGGFFGDLGYGSVVKNFGCKFTTEPSRSSKCVVFAYIMWGATIDNCYIEYMQTHSTADFVGISAASKQNTMSNTVIYAYQKSVIDQAGVVTSYASGGKSSIATDNVIMIYRSENSYFGVRMKSGGGVDTWDDSIEGLYKVDGTGENSLSFDYGQQKLSLTKTINGRTSNFSSANYNSKYFDTDTACGIPKWKNK